MLSTSPEPLSFPWKVSAFIDSSPSFLVQPPDNPSSHLISGRLAASVPSLAHPSTQPGPPHPPSRPGGGEVLPAASGHHSCCSQTPHADMGWPPRPGPSSASPALTVSAARYGQHVIALPGLELIRPTLYLTCMGTSNRHQNTHPKPDSGGPHLAHTPTPFPLPSGDPNPPSVPKLSQMGTGSEPTAFTWIPCVQLASPAQPFPPRAARPQHEAKCRRARLSLQTAGLLLGPPASAVQPLLPD